MLPCRWSFYDVDVRTINYHLKTIFTDSELEADAVIRKFRMTAADGKTYERAVQLRKCATRVVELLLRAHADGDELVAHRHRGRSYSEVR